MLFHNNVVGVVLQFKKFAVGKIVTGRRRHYILSIPEEQLWCNERLRKNEYTVFLFLNGLKFINGLLSLDKFAQQLAVAGDLIKVRFLFMDELRQCLFFKVDR